MSSKDFKLPDLGEGVHEGQVLRVMVSPGDTVREDQPLMEVETDKAAVVIPCPFSGIVEKVHVRDGQLVHVGEVMVTIGDGKGAVEPKPTRVPATSVAQADVSRPAKAISAASRAPTPTATLARRVRSLELFRCRS